MDKKILFIAPYPYDEAPSQRFRFEQYFGAFKANGLDPEVVPFLDEKGWKALYKDGNFVSKGMAMLRSFLRRFALLFKLKQYDYIFIHREAAMIGPPIIEWFIAKVFKRKYIYDFDDAIWLPNYSEANAKFHKLKAYAKVKRIIKWADKVTVGNTFLAEYANQYNDNIEVIPTTIDTVNVHNKAVSHDAEKVVIGWTGTHTTAQYLNEIIPIIKDLESIHNIEFRVISNHHPGFKLECLNYIKWSRETEVEDLLGIQIGIMPMTDSDWTKGKCGFKALQYMALGMAAVVSPVGVNTAIVQNDVNGLICSTPEDWKNALQRLINSAELRNRLGLNGQKTVRDSYSVLAYQNNYLNLFR